MSEAFIVRRGGSGGGKGFDPNGAVLKVITSTGCSVSVSGTGYNQTHEQSDGFPRSGDANVTEHFFSIPAYAFGEITVVATNAYGNNTRTVTIDTAGKIYDVLCGGRNIILNSDFGLQSGLSIYTDWSYSDRYRRIDTKYPGSIHGEGNLFTSPIPIAAYSRITVTTRTTLVNEQRRITRLFLRDDDNVRLCEFTFDAFTINPIQEVGDISNKYYPNAELIFTGDEITEIVFS